MNFQEKKKDDCASVKNENEYAPTNLLCEHNINPLGIDVTQPRFSWVLNYPERGQFQLACQIFVASSQENLNADNADKWDSGKIASGQSINILYTGTPLKSGKTYYWKARIWDKDGKVSLWSKIAIFEMGLLKSDNWEGKWISGGNLLRKEFTFNKNIKRARAYICGLGYYELRVNGEKVGDHVLDPGWTDYEKRALYVPYDIISYLQRGENAIGVMLGRGRYSPLDEMMKGANLFKRYADSPVLIMQIDIDFTDDSSIRIVTDETWKAAQGPIVEDSIYNGEIYDARLEKLGWDAPCYDNSDWDAAEVVDVPEGDLVS